MAAKTKLADRWLRRWEDEDGELAAVVRKDGAYWLKTIGPAWEPNAGEVQYVKFNTLKAAQTYEYDPMLGCTDNAQAEMEHDPFFA